MCDVPRRPRRVRGGEHVVAGIGVVVPPCVRRDVDRRELPGLPPIGDSVVQATGLFLLADLQPVLDEDDARFNHEFLDPDLDEALREAERAIHAALDNEGSPLLNSDEHDQERSYHVNSTRVRDVEWSFHFNGTRMSLLDDASAYTQTVHHQTSDAASPSERHVDLEFPGDYYKLLDDLARAPNHEDGEIAVLRIKFPAIKRATSIGQPTF